MPEGGQQAEGERRGRGKGKREKRVEPRRKEPEKGGGRSHRPRRGGVPRRRGGQTVDPSLHPSLWRAIIFAFPQIWAANPPTLGGFFGPVLLDRHC